jgi:hypothetical protein
MASNTTTSELASIQSAGFGSFVFFCKDVPSVPWCNLFYRQLSRTAFVLEDPTTAPVGINPVCGIPRAGNSSLGNIANDIACALSAAFGLYLIHRCNRRKAAVGRIELRATLTIYIATCILQLLTTGSIFAQGSDVLVVLTAIHAGAVASFFWCLVANALVATQIVEDGTPSSLLPFHGFSVIFFVSTTYIALDTAMGFTSVFKSVPPNELKNIGLFILVWLWPAVAVLVYFGVMCYIVFTILQERKPCLLYIASFLLFVGSQVIYMVASKMLCQASNGVLDGSFIATVLETGSLGLLFFAWMKITESSWDTQYMPFSF